MENQAAGGSAQKLKSFGTDSHDAILLLSHRLSEDKDDVYLLAPGKLLNKDDTQVQAVTSNVDKMLDEIFWWKNKAMTLCIANSGL